MVDDNSRGTATKTATIFAPLVLANVTAWSVVVGVASLENGIMLLLLWLIAAEYAIELSDQ